MSIEINTVIIAGNLTNAVVVKDTSIGRKVGTFTVANNRTFIRNNSKTKETSFIDVEVWGVMAENCGRYLQKGSPVVVNGHLKQSRWETSQGERRSRLKVMADSVQFLSSAKRSHDDLSHPQEEAADIQSLAMQGGDNAETSFLQAAEAEDTHQK